MVSRCGFSKYITFLDPTERYRRIPPAWQGKAASLPIYTPYDVLQPVTFCVTTGHLITTPSSASCLLVKRSRVMARHLLVCAAPVTTLFTPCRLLPPHRSTWIMCSDIPNMPKEANKAKCFVISCFVLCAALPRALVPVNPRLSRVQMHQHSINTRLATH